MASIAVKRVYEAPAATDGMRVLVDRLWPRGLTKEAAALDLWSKELAPSTRLRAWFAHRPERVEEFARRYRAELAGNHAVAEVLSALGRRKVTLVYAVRDPAVSHAPVLAAFLRGARTGAPG